MTESVVEEELPDNSVENKANKAIMSEEAGDVLDQDQMSAIELDQGELQESPVREIEKGNVLPHPGRAL